MLSKMKRVLLLMAVVLLLLISGCATVTVKEINDDPGKYMGKKVIVSGKVVIPMDMGIMSGFTLKDDGSTIMVSSDDVPESGSEVVVKGTVVKGLFSGRYIYAEYVKER
jgi:hypothetical protein